ncbi:MAG: ABC transporter ATP-binding protein [Alphaproteobacteria bacterium]|nr:ABC transporter ATP-binding protein [Alphaproteobacteria bacterium]
MNNISPTKTPVLKVENLEAWYGESHILHGMSFDVREGEVVTLLGRNGAGKTTTLRSIMGIVETRTGTIEINGKSALSVPAHKISPLGIAYCPEERGIYKSLTVRENLMLPPVIAPGGMSVDEIFDLFPNIAERLNSGGGNLSGGEQQMLAIARILRTGCRLLLLDEPTEGLAPVIVQAIGRVLKMLKARGYTILLVEQNFRFASTVADRHYVVEHGQVIDEIANSDIGRESARLHEYLGI